MGRPTKAEILEQKEKAIKEIKDMTINRACEILNNKGCYIIVADEYNRTMREYQKMRSFLDVIYPQFKVYIQTDASKYHLAGDSIVTTCLMGLFGELLGIDYKAKIRELTKDLANE